MRAVMRVAAPVAMTLALGACSLGGLLGGGGKVPPTLMSLTPEAPPPGEYARTSAVGEAVTISIPVIPKELRTVRIPAQVSPTDVAYIEDVRLVDTPDRLFQDLLAETVRRTTRRIVLDPKQSALDPGITVTGQLHRFGFDEASSTVIVRYDASLSTGGGAHIQTRRFEASVSATGVRGSVGPALNRAANQVALEVANWIGG